MSYTDNIQKWVCLISYNFRRNENALTLVQTLCHIVTTEQNEYKENDPWKSSVNVQRFNRLHQKENFELLTIANIHFVYTARNYVRDCRTSKNEMDLELRRNLALRCLLGMNC